MVFSKISQRRSTAASRFLFLAPAFALLVLICWALASPVGASPDDDFHLTSTWCAQGTRDAICEPGSDPSRREVPAGVANSAICYAYHSDRSAECQSQYLGTDVPMVETYRGNFGGLYPPLFYAVDGLFVSSDIAASVVIMRVVNSLIFLAMTVTTFLLLPARRKPVLVWGLLISLVPLGIFIIPSNNPSGWAVISAGTLWIALVGFFESSGRRKIGLAVISLAAAFIGAGSRVDAAMYAVFACIVATILTARRTRDFLISLWLPVVIMIVAVSFYFSASQGAVAAGGMSAGASGAAPNSLFLVMVNTINLPLLWAGVFGSWGLGWLDTNLPGVVSVGALAVFLMVAFNGLSSTTWRKNLVLAGTVFALWALPSYILWQARAQVGTEVQPRYILPLMVILAGVALFRFDKLNPTLSRLQQIVVIALLVAAHALALHTNIRRYTTGLDVNNWNLDARVEWWWSIPFSPMTVWFIGSLSFGVLVWTFVRQFSASVTEEIPPAQDSVQIHSVDTLKGARLKPDRGAPDA